MKKQIILLFLSLIIPIKAFANNKEAGVVEDISSKQKPLKNSLISVSNNQIKAKHVAYDSTSQLITATGNIEIISQGYKLNSDKVTYDIKLDQVIATGNVSVKDNKGLTIYGDYIVLKNKFKEGAISSLILHLPNNVQVTAREAIKQGANFGSLKEATYTPCPVCKASAPQWRLRAKTTNINYDKEKVTYKHAFFEIYGVPVFYTPYFVHPTPNAKAQSGILVPQVQDNSLKIPIYWRPKSNLDMTLTPRIMKNKTIYEGELRHKLYSGSYQVEGSITRDDRVKNHDNKDLRSSHFPYRYHILSNGNFQQNEYKYGFLLERSSDKSYMKNFNYGNKPYLVSRMYLDHSSYTNYYTIETMKFQGMRKRDSNATDPLILPHIFYKSKIPHENKSIYSTLEGDVLAYMQSDGTKVNRASLKYLGTKNITIDAHIVDLSVYLRNDLYSTTSIHKNDNELYSVVKKSNKSQNLTKFYLTPEQHTSWKYSLLQRVKDDRYFEIEPKILLVLGRRNNKYRDLLINTDSQYLELRDDNLFHNNRYSGIDNHEYGSRASYGIKMSSNEVHGNFNSSMFLGQLYRLVNNDRLPEQSGMKGKKSNIVGKLDLDILNNTYLYYKFSKDSKKITSEKEEVGALINYKKLTSSAIFSSLKNYVTPEEERFIRQMSINLGYKLGKKWEVNTGVRTNLSSKALRNIIDYGISVTYFGECVKITAKFINNYTSDRERGIKKSHSNTYSIGLRTLNY
jgi:LPS-assembly protein